MAQDRADHDVEFFVDRSLGKSIAIGLREVGLVVHTMSEVFGEAEGQLLKDEDWLNEIGNRGWTILTKDKKIRRRPAEIQALLGSNAKVFCLVAGQLKGAEQLRRFANNRHRMLQQARKPGPFIYGVYERGIRRLHP